MMAHDRPPINKAIEVVRWFLSDDEVLSAWPRIRQMDVVEARETLFGTAALAGALVDTLATASAMDKTKWFDGYVADLLSKRDGP